MAGIDPSRAWAELSEANRLYRLQAVGHQAPAAIEALRVEGWVQREAVSGLFEMRIVCLSLDASLELKSLIGQPLTLLTVLADGTMARRSGLVRAAEALGADGGLARYRLTLVPWLWLATQQGRSQVFQNRTVTDIVEHILAPYADAGPWALSPEVQGFLADAPVRTHCTQYRESDFDILQRLLAEEGLAWRVEEDEAAPMAHRVVLFAANADQPADPASPIRFHRKSSQEQSDAVQALVRRMRQSAAQVHLSTWHVDSKRQLSASAPTRWPVGGPRAARLEYDDVQGLSDQARNWNDSRTVERYAGLLMEAAECRADMLLGHSTARTLRAGTRIEVSDAPALGLQAAPHLLLDTIEHVGINNLPRDTAASIEAQLGDLLQHLVFDAPCAGVTAEADVFGLAPTTTATATDTTAEPAQPADTAHLHPDPTTLATAQTTGYANSFSGVHEARPWRPAIAAASGGRLHAKPTVHGVQSAIVVGPSGETTPNGADELYCNARGDVRLRFHWQRDEEPQQDNRSTRWTRVAQRQAGPGMGWQWLPRIGQEVLVRFADGDIDQPIVIGTLYNGRGEGGTAPTPGGEQRGDPRAPNAYALLDMAFEPELIRRLQKLAGPDRMQSVFAGAYDGPDLDAVAPQLISLPADDESRLTMLQHLLKATDGQPMLSFITTDLTTIEFKAHLQHQMEATTPDGKEWMLRFADTRTLHALLTVFGTDQRERFLAGIDQWIYFDRAGQLLVVPGGPWSAAPETLPYALAADQAARLKNLALPDALLFNIAKRPDLFGRLLCRLSVAHACIEAALAKLPQAKELHDATLYSAVLAALSEKQLIAETVT